MPSLVKIRVVSVIMRCRGVIVLRGLGCAFSCAKYGLKVAATRVMDALIVFVVMHEEYASSGRWSDACCYSLKHLLITFCLCVIPAGRSRRGTCP